MKYDSDEYRALMEKRKAAGRLIDPQTCEMAWWYAQTLDPYGDGLELAPEEYQVGREYFVRAPGSDTVVLVEDLSDEIYKEVERLRKAGHYDKPPDPSHDAEALALVDRAVIGLIKSMDGIDFHTLDDFNKAIDGAVDECKANRKTVALTLITKAHLILEKEAGNDHRIRVG
jgi:hypothetical protein